MEVQLVVSTIFRLTTTVLYIQTKPALVVEQDHETSKKMVTRTSIKSNSTCHICCRRNSVFVKRVFVVNSVFGNSVLVNNHARSVVEDCNWCSMSDLLFLQKREPSTLSLNLSALPLS
ncbi:hypothetical protein DPMN_063315 [Dreissena polymorpha]|uniref:Uncharacterized protein n=1 Tax=Dreissena polymorpha TaxID=45954 RepID=A0A9D4CAA2_DREPO|nr:hypothetical protein DPMN_063315 [Dreissena polymorpha]